MPQPFPRTTGTDQCSACKEVLPASEFDSDHRKRSGLKSQCRACAREKCRLWAAGLDAEGKERRRQSTLRWRAANPEAVRAMKRKATYGIDRQTYDTMRAAQGGCCAVCSEELQGGRREHVDHSHATGAVRAILCFRCNLALGHAHESPERLMALASYVVSREGGDAK